MAGPAPASSSSTGGCSTILSGDDCVLEREPLETAGCGGQLMAYRHDGFFFAMDTYREYQYLNELWDSRRGALEGMAVSTGFWPDRPAFWSPAPPAWSAAGWCAAARGRRRRRLPGARLGAAERAGPRRADRAGQGGARRRARPGHCWSASLGEYEIDTVFHLAAQTIVGIANRNPVSTFESNIRGTWNVLEACRRSPAVKADRRRLLRQGLRRPGRAALRRRRAARRADIPTTSASPART